MTAAALHAEIGSARQGWRALLWIALLTAAWIAVNFAFPVIAATGMPTVAARLAIHVLIGLGLWLGLERTQLSPAQRCNLWLAVMIPFTLWLSLIWGAAINGAFLVGDSPIPIPIPLTPLAIFIPVIIGAPILLRSRRIGEVLDAMPATWLIALQVYRVLGSVFLIGWVRGVVPGIFGLPAGIGDVATGLLALPVAVAAAAGTIEGRRAGIAWNIFGLLDLTVAVGIGLITSPGPLQLIVPSVSNAQLGAYPSVLIPAFAVPSSILLHVLSLRQLYRRGRRGEMRTPAAALA
jgi:hypothetical protein